MRTASLPIWELHASLLETLQTHQRLVLVAPTGSGKTTQVPQMLLDAGLGGDKRLVVLQPRRVAARTVAARVAQERHCPLGTEVGYQIRFDDQTSQGTRISFVTEGILLRWLQEDPALSRVGVLLFDEFHERNLLSDVALALVKRLQQTSRPDLKLLVMSATLDAAPIAAYLGSPGLSSSQDGLSSSSPCPVLVSEGQSFPVTVRYQAQLEQRPLSEQAADSVEAILQSGEPGDILIFMPGMSEINATLGALHAVRASERFLALALHGDLPAEQQDLAFAPNSLRKVIVATNVAETSVTIDGVRHVIDSGQARVARYDAERGINTLFIEPISRASADQRKGRAGRTAPGTCYRLWTESGQLNRPERNTPEIQRCDLAEVVLLLHSLGIRQASAFDWLDRPSPQAVQRAEDLLVSLGALRPPHAASSEKQASHPGTDLTSTGQRMLRLPMHPRYSRMLVEASRRGCVPAAALCAALASGRDLLMRLGRNDSHLKEARELFEASPLSDFYTLIRAYQFAKNNHFNVDACRRYGIHAQTARQIEQTCEQILNIAQPLLASATDSSGPGPEARSPHPAQDDPLLRCIMTGFVDQLCVRRDSGTLECDLTEGRQGTLPRESVVQAAPLFVAASIRQVPGRSGEPLTLLGLASAVQRPWLEETFPEQFSARVEHLYDRTHKRVAAVKLIRFRDLVLGHEHQRELDPKAAGRCLAEAHLKGCFELPLFNHELKQFIARVNLIAWAMPELELPAFTAQAVLASLAQAFEGLSLAKEAQAAPLRPAFAHHLAQEQLSWLDELTPLTVLWPDGRRLKLQYEEASGQKQGSAPTVQLQIKLHECFPLAQHPRLCEGRVPVTLWLCAPDGKRLESTTDWPSFKSTAYPRLRSTLQKKYPGVAWL